MNEHISVMTDFGELIATPFAGGISVDINLPDGKGSGQLAFIESTPAELQDEQYKKSPWNLELSVT